MGISVVVRVISVAVVGGIFRGAFVSSLPIRLRPVVVVLRLRYGYGY